MSGPLDPNHDRAELDRLIDRILDGDAPAESLGEADAPGESWRELAMLRHTTEQLRSGVEVPDMTRDILRAVHSRRGFAPRRVRRQISAVRGSIAAGVLVTLGLFAVAEHAGLSTQIRGESEPMNRLTQSTQRDAERARANIMQALQSWNGEATAIAPEASASSAVRSGTDAAARMAPVADAPMQLAHREPMARSVAELTPVERIADLITHDDALRMRLDEIKRDGSSGIQIAGFSGRWPTGVQPHTTSSVAHSEGTTSVSSGTITIRITARQRDDAARASAVFLPTRPVRSQAVTWLEPWTMTTSDSSAQERYEWSTRGSTPRTRLPADLPR